MRFQRIPRIRDRVLRPARKAAQLANALQGKRRLHFLHIRKTGGTAVKHALKEHLVGRDYSLTLHEHETTLRDIPDGHGVIFFLRNPVTRFVSGFNSRKRQGRPRYDWPWNDAESSAFAIFESPGALALALSSSDEDLRMQAVKAMNGIRHVRHTYDYWLDSDAYLRSRADDLFYVGFQESLSADFAALRNLLCLPETVRLPDDDYAAHRNPASDESLSDLAIENLHAWYAKDFAFIDYVTALAKRNADQ